jgi:hypothetical protein
MKTFTTPIPSNNNAPGSGSPFVDVVRAIDALVEIRSSVPNTAGDLGAAEVVVYNNLLSQIADLEKSVNSFQP